jgi:hypothetical protein
VPVFKRTDVTRALVAMFEFVISSHLSAAIARP